MHGETQNVNESSEEGTKRCFCLQENSATIACNFGANALLKVFMKVNIHEETSIFFNKMMSNLLLPAVTIPTKMNTVNDTLIDNIFNNAFNPDMISGNFSIDISDHLL